MASAANPVTEPLGPRSPAAPPHVEEALLVRLRGGDQNAFAELVDAYHASLVRLARTLLGSGPWAEEVVQETWEAFVRGLSQFEGRSTVKTWLYQVVINRAKTRAVKESRIISFSAADPKNVFSPTEDPARFAPDGHWVAPPGSWADNPEELLSRRQLLSHIEAAIALLPPQQAAVVTLRDVDGLDAAETCNILGIAETNQRVLLHRARAKLRQALEHLLDER